MSTATVLIIIGSVYLLGAIAAAATVSVMDRLDVREHPGSAKSDADAVVFVALIWPLVVLYLSIRYIYRNAISPALEKITDVAESVINESKNRKDRDSDQ